MAKKINTSDMKPYTTTITMDVKDIKHITDEDLKIEKPIKDYEKLLLKVYWYLKGLNTTKENEQIDELIEMIEDFI